MTVVRTKEDGDCMYSATSVLVYGSVFQGSMIREKSGDYFNACICADDFYKDIIESKGKQVDAFLRAKVNGAWGDLVDVYGLAEMYRRKFVVYDEAG